MRVTVVKKEKESNERCIARFTKAVQASRKVKRIRSTRYHAKKATKTKQRAAAVMREHYRGLRAKTKFYA